MSDETRRAAERAARFSYGRLVSLLAARTHDIAAAEDALGAAFTAALSVWPDRGVPDNPEAWLLTAARRAAGHGARHRNVQDAAQQMLVLLHEEIAAREAPELPDDRLKLLFVCAHPAIDAAVRTPLMLQTVLGLDAATIGAAFLTSPAAMGQRLVRAKAKIKDAKLRFETPDDADLPQRLSAVLAAIYAAYGTAWDQISGADADRGLGEEAIFLARLLVTLLPDEAEPKGLLALMLHCEARADARRDCNGRYVPLAEQDHSRWTGAMIEEAEAQLIAASRLRSAGRYQTEAAIQSLHAQRAITRRDNADALALLYDVLVAQAPSTGALVARAAARAAASGTEAGLSLLDRLDDAQCRSYQPYWATRADLLKRAGREADAQAAYDRAIGLSRDQSVRDYLMDRRNRIFAPASD